MTVAVIKYRHSPSCTGRCQCQAPEVWIGRDLAEAQRLARRNLRPEWLDSLTITVGKAATVSEGNAWLDRWNAEPYDRDPETGEPQDA